MMKKKLFLLFVLAGAMPLTMMAQDDDLYFVPSKKTVETKGSSVKNIAEGPTYYAGSPRDVDEYNRRGKFRSTFQKIGVDSLGNDIIEFHVGSDIYPDTSYVDTTWTASKAYGNDYDGDFTYSRRMSRWDGYYGWYDPVFYCHWGMFPMGYYSWYDPWYYWHYYDFAWYSPWYDPWYYGYYGWGYPYRWYGRYGWGYPYPGWGPGFYPSYAIRTSPGTHNHGRPSYNSPRGSFTGNSHSYSQGTFGGSRNTGYRNRSTASSGNTRPVRRSDGSYSNSNGNFGGSRSTYESHSSGSYSAPSRSSSTSSFGGSTYGGSRSGGGGGGFSGGGSSGGGGSRSGGGGGFGGRR